MERLDRRDCLENATTSRAQKIPRHVEESELGGVQERVDRLALVEAVVGGQLQGVDPTELEVCPLENELLDDGKDRGSCRLSKSLEPCIPLSHDRIPSSVSAER